MFLATGYARSLAAVSAPQGGAGLVLLVWLAGLASPYFSKRSLAEVVYSESDSANSVSLPSERCANTRHRGVQKEEATSDLKDQRKRHIGGYMVTEKTPHRRLCVHFGVKGWQCYHSVTMTKCLKQSSYKRRSVYFGLPFRSFGHKLSWSR